MEPTLEDHAPRARCYHCGKAMCHEHSSTVTGPDGKPVSQEFSGLELTGKQAGAYHCDEHDHIVKGDLKKFIFLGIGIATAGVVLCFVSLVVGLVLLVAGAGL